MLVICASCYGDAQFGLNFQLKSLLCESFLNFFVMCLYKNCITGEQHITYLLGHLKEQVKDPSTYTTSSNGLFLPKAFERITMIRHTRDECPGILITIEFDARLIQFRNQEPVMPVRLSKLPELFDMAETDLAELEKQLYASEELELYFGKQE